MPVNILYCEGNTDGTVGGSFFSLLYLVSGLDKSKFNPIVVFHNEHSLLPKYKEAGISTIIVPAYVPVGFKVPRCLAPARRLVAPVVSLARKTTNLLNGFFIRALFCARFIRQQKVALVHLNNSIIRNNDWMLGALLAGVPCVTHERGINNHYPLLSRILARHLRAIICISNSVRDNLKKHSIDPGNLATIYNGIDTTTVSPTITKEALFEKHDIYPASRIIGVIGNIKPWKGQEVVIRALPLIVKCEPAIVCLFVGDIAACDEHYHSHLVRLADEMGVTEKIRFTGYTTNVADYINAMEIVIHSSVDPEPFGRVLIEAMSMSKPVVGSRGGAVPEIIDEGTTGLIFEAGDSASLADAINQLLIAKEKAVEMGKNGGVRVRENFNISTNVRKTEQLYASILDVS